MKPAQKLLRIQLRIDTRAFVTIYKIVVCIFKHSLNRILKKKPIKLDSIVGFEITLS